MFKFTEDQDKDRGSGRQVRQAGIILAISGLLLFGCDSDGESEIDLYQHIYQTPGEILVNPPVTS